MDTVLEGQKAALELAVHDAPLSEILSVLVRTIETHASAGVRASILLLDRDGLHLRHGAAPNLPDEYNTAIDGLAIGPVGGSCGTAAYTRKRVIVNDIETDPLWEPYKHLALPHNLRACWSTPILSVNGDVLGTFALYHPKKAFNPPPQDLEIIDLLTHTAAIIIQRHRETEDRRAAEQALIRAKEEAEQANRAKDQFLAMLAHELRNPLAPIVTALELSRMRGAELTGEYAIIERQVGHLVRLIEDLLDMARFARGDVDLRHERVEMSQIVNRALEIAAPLIQEKKHALSINIPAKGLAVNGDPVRLAQIASNLITNAAKYTNPGGDISVSASAENGRAVLRVRDNGIGLTPEMRAQIFEPFVQEEDALDRARGGLGLGLAIVQKLVRLHQGTVEAISEGRDRGSEFILRLPLSAEAPRAEEPRPEETPKRAAEPARILIVDDNEDAAVMLSHSLRRMGYTVAVAYDGEAGLTTAKQFKPDIALLDIALPKINGYELGRQLRKTRGLEGVRLVAATGSARISDQDRSTEAGFDAHLVKPISIRTLSRTLDDLVAKR